jgi:predicted nucleic acid-binding protein
MSNEIRVYFDACCFIDMAQVQFKLGLEKGRDDHAFFCKKFIDAARVREVVVITSMLTLAECICLKDFSKNVTDPARKLVTDEVKRLFEVMILSGRSGVLPYQQTPATTRKARDLVFDNVLKKKIQAMDRLHIAAALISKCKYFVTTDKDIIENKDVLNELGLTVCTADSIKGILPDKYRQSEIK